jgi:Relaxase/Mobilisation nuclease domain
MATEKLTLGRAWDDNFHDWTDDLQLGKKRRKPKQASKTSSLWTGKVISVRAVQEYPGRGSKGDVRGRLQGIARNTRQVVVKITPGKNLTMKAVKKHLQYIGEDGAGVVRDQNGMEFKGKEAVDDLAWGWQHTGPLMPEVSDTRLAFNIMFSMPEGTDERALYAAVKATADVEFAKHQWAIGQHLDEPQVHCHVCVKAESMEGIRLNPRKADLQRWRERFAHELRERGVNAEATKRAQRMHQKRTTKPWAVTRLEERGLPVNPPPTLTEHIKIEKWKRSEAKVVSSIDRIIGALEQSSDAVDRILAQELQGKIAARGVERVRAIGSSSGKEIERI